MKQTKVLMDIYPKDFKFTPNMVIQEFDNKHDYIHSLNLEGPLKDKINIFVKQLQNGVDVDQETIKKIRNEVRNNLIKRGIITGTVYEGFKYDVEGIIVDYAELASGNPECMMKPVKVYDKWFYELYVNMSIPYFVTEDKISEGAIRLIETVKALEEINIEIKINVVMTSEGLYNNGKSFLMIIPICNHLEFKDYNLLFPFICGNFLRGPIFDTLHRAKNDYNAKSIGGAYKLDNSLNIWELEETALAERVINDLDMGRK